MLVRIHRAPRVAYLAGTLLAGTILATVPSLTPRAFAEEEHEAHHPPAQAEVPAEGGERAGQGGMQEHGGMQGQGGMQEHGGMQGQGGMQGHGGMQGCMMMQGGKHEGGMQGCKMMGGEHAGTKGEKGEHAGAASADQPGTKGDHAGMMTGEMRKKMHQMMAEMASRVDERIATLKAELAITDAQLPLWNAFADTLRSAAKAMEQTHKEMMAAEASEPKEKPAAAPEPSPGGATDYPGKEAIKKLEPAPASGSLPGKLQAHERRLTQHVESLKAIEAALIPLYAGFDAKQKQAADKLMIGPMGIM